MAKPPEGVKGPGANIFGKTVELTFQALAEYTEKGACRCECCRFAQFIMMDNMTWTLATRGADGEYPKPEEVVYPVPWTLRDPGEDCFWLVFDAKSGEYKKRLGSPDNKPQPDPAVPDKPVYGPFCYGDKDTADDADVRGLPRPAQTITECMVETTDIATEWVPLGYWWSWNVVFAGVILDRCNSWVPRRLKLFDGSSEGRVETATRYEITRQPQK